MKRSWNRKWRPRRPGGRRPPTRWIDGSSFWVDECTVRTISVPCAWEPNTPQPVPFQGCFPVVAGEVDLDWADKSESRLDRVVGDISIQSVTQVEIEDELTWPILRMGMLVVEDIDDISTYLAPNLFDHDHLEEFEWMWLKQTSMFPQEGYVHDASPIEQGNRFWVWKDQHIDVGVRRKLGKADHLILVAQMARPLSTAVFNFAVSYTPLLRCVFVN